jgi:hypothetical protein
VASFRTLLETLHTEPFVLLTFLAQKATKCTNNGESTVYFYDIKNKKRAFSKDTFLKHFNKKSALI